MDYNIPQYIKTELIYCGICFIICDNRRSEQALKQMDDKRYDVEMQDEEIENIFKLGIAFSGKKIKIKSCLEKVK